jgi:hypothetical protein
MKIVLTQINSDAIIHFAGQVRTIIPYGLNGKSEKKIKKLLTLTKRYDIIIFADKNSETQKNTMNF